VDVPVAFGADDDEHAANNGDSPAITAAEAIRLLEEIFRP
jgi:uncharacterized protein (UPF0147 family)